MSSAGSIAVLTTVHPALDGRIFHKEATSLRAAGFPVTLVAPDSEGVAETTASAGIEFEPLPRGESRHVRPGRWVVLVGRLWARRRVDSIWHFHDPELLVVCVLSRALFARSTNLVYDAHEDPAGTVAYKEWLPGLLRRPIAALTSGIEGFLARRCELVVAATEPIAEAHRSRSVDDVVVVRNYPRLAGTPLQDPPDRPADGANGPVRVVYSGSITVARGVNEMVAAIDRLADLDVELELIGRFGDPGLRREIEAAAGPRVEITGLLPGRRRSIGSPGAMSGWCACIPSPTTSLPCPRSCSSTSLRDWPWWRRTSRPGPPMWSRSARVVRSIHSTSTPWPPSSGNW